MKLYAVTLFLLPKMLVLATDAHSTCFYNEAVLANTTSHLLSLLLVSASACYATPTTELDSNFIVSWQYMEFPHMRSSFFFYFFGISINILPSIVLGAR